MGYLAGVDGCKTIGRCTGLRLPGTERGVACAAYRDHPTGRSAERIAIRPRRCVDQVLHVQPGGSQRGGEARRIRSSCQHHPDDASRRVT